VNLRTESDVEIKYEFERYLGGTFKIWDPSVTKLITKSELISTNFGSYLIPKSSINEKNLKMEFENQYWRAIR
jgi:hypothetical protein